MLSGVVKVLRKFQRLNTVHNQVEFSNKTLHLKLFSPHLLLLCRGHKSKLPGVFLGPTALFPHMREIAFHIWWEQMCPARYVSEMQLCLNFCKIIRNFYVDRYWILVFEFDSWFCSVHSMGNSLIKKLMDSSIPDLWRPHSAQLHLPPPPTDSSLWNYSVQLPSQLDPTFTTEKQLLGINGVTLDWVRDNCAPNIFIFIGKDCKTGRNKLNAPSSLMICFCQLTGRR